MSNNRIINKCNNNKKIIRKIVNLKRIKSRKIMKRWIKINIMSLLLNIIGKKDCNVRDQVFFFFYNVSPSRRKYSKSFNF